VRPDKLALAALKATLAHYLKGEVNRIPIWQMMSLQQDELEERARRWQAQLGPRASVERSRSTIGGGSLPGETLDTWVVSLRCDDLPGGVEGVAQRLRGSDSPVLGRIEEDRLLIDPRTVFPEEETSLLKVVAQALAGGER
jgi:L-seryl-tRNA(Ser) seleniumtransferase